MTVIVSDGRYVAADTLIVSDSGMMGRTCKLAVFGSQVLAHSGAADHGQMLEIWFKDGKKPDAFPKTTADKDAYLYVFEYGKPTMCFQSWPAPVILIEKTVAAGAGGPYALAALHLGCDARRAVDVAIECNVYCGGDIEYVDLKQLADTGSASVVCYED